MESWKCLTIFKITFILKDLISYLHNQSEQISFQNLLKHKYSFGKSENLSKTYYAEILVFHPDYECKSSRVMVSSEPLLSIFNIVYFELFWKCSEGLRTNLHTLLTTPCKAFIIKSLI